MALSDYYEQIDQALQKLSEALDLLDEIPSDEIEVGKIDEFEEIAQQVDDAAVGLQELISEESMRERDEEEHVVEGEFRRIS